MSAAFDRLISVLPPQSAAATSAQSVEAMQERLGHLQLAGRGLALRHILGALTEVNGVRMPAAQRLEIIDISARTAASFIKDTRNEARETFPLSAECQEDARLVSEIERELAIGYIAAVQTLCAPAGKLPFLRGAVVASALVSACKRHASRLYHAASMRSEPSPGVWQGLHEVFAFAVDVGLANRELAVADSSTKTSVRAIYMQALLLALAKPNQFTRQQLRQIQDGLPLFASWCDIRPGFAHAGMISVHVAGDLSPLAVRGTPSGTDDLWGLDVAALVGRLDELLAEQAGEEEIRFTGRRGNTSLALASEVAATLKRVWSERIARGQPRDEDTTRFETETGLSKVHALISGWPDFEAALPDTGTVHETSLPSARGRPITALAKHATAVALDRSRTGYRLRWAVGEDANARVGELIALAPAGREKRRWRYGHLRWLRVDSNTAIEAGVELLPTSLLAVAVYPIDVNGNVRPPVPGIFVDVPASRSARGGGPGIIVPKPFVRDAVSLDVLCMDADTPRDEWPQPVRIAQFTLRNAGVYQMILLADEALARIAPMVHEAAIG